MATEKELKSMLKKYGMDSFDSCAVDLFTRLLVQEKTLENFPNDPLAQEIETTHHIIHEVLRWIQGHDKNNQEHRKCIGKLRNENASLREQLAKINFSPKRKK